MTNAVRIKDEGHKGEVRCHDTSLTSSVAVPRTNERYDASSNMGRQCQCIQPCWLVVDQRPASWQVMAKLVQKGLRSRMYATSLFKALYYISFQRLDKNEYATKNKIKRLNFAFPSRFADVSCSVSFLHYIT